MSGEESPPCFVDEHRIRIAATRDEVWRALRDHVDSRLGMAAANPPARLLGTEPPSGFQVWQEDPVQRLALSGRHRFSHYLLVFEVADTADGGTVLSARTFADFPGLHGTIYRALVIGTRVHVLAVRRMLHSIAWPVRDTRHG